MAHYCGVICREVPEVQFPQLVFMSDRGESGARFIPVELLHGCLQAHPRMGTPSRMSPGSSPYGSSPTLPPGSSIGGSSSMASFRSMPGWYLLHHCFQAHPWVGAPPQIPPGSSLGGSSSTVVPASSPGVSSSMAAFRFMPGWEFWHGCLQVDPWVGAPKAASRLILRRELLHGFLWVHSPPGDEVGGPSITASFLFNQKLNVLLWLFLSLVFLIPCFTYVCANSAYYMITEPGGLRCASSWPPPLTI